MADRLHAIPVSVLKRELWYERQKWALAEPEQFVDGYLAGLAAVEKLVERLAKTKSRRGL